MARKKKELFPIGFCGIFFPTEVLEDFKKFILEDKNDEIEVRDFYSYYIGTFDFKNYEHLNSMILIHSENVVMDEKIDDGYFIGVNIFDVPEQFSMKRIKIDVRAIFESLGLIDSDDDNDVVQIYPQIVKI